MSSTYDEISRTEDLIFSPASQNFSRTLTALKRSRLSIANRLRSIHHDAEFVGRVKDELDLPVVANERCGSWYVPPWAKAGSAYFKSTDGHQGQWKFSTRRLNLQVLEILGTHGGCILVDSTRQGKSIPDALSKTVAIWCCTMNRVLFPNLTASHQLRIPAQCVAPSEHAQMVARLEQFEQALSALDLDLFSLRRKLRKPIQLEWITPGSFPIHREQKTLDSDYNLLVCCTASHREDSINGFANGTYIQGAGDDSEGWMSGSGLTPELFWQHSKELLAMEDADIEAFMAAISSLPTPIDTSAVSILPGKFVAVGSLSSATEAILRRTHCLVTCLAKRRFEIEEPERSDSICPTLELVCGSGKLGSRALRTQLPLLLPFLDEALARHTSSKEFRILVTCATGRDLSVGVALAILCLYADRNGALRSKGISQAAVTTVSAGDPSIDKGLIKQRLAWIMSSKSEAHPSGATLQAINAFLMSH